MGKASDPRRRNIPAPRSHVRLNDDERPLGSTTKWSFYDFHHEVRRAAMQIQNAAEEVSNTATAAELHARDQIAQQAAQLLRTLQGTPDLNAELSNTIRGLGFDPADPKAVREVRDRF